jgi:hypothetical protein
LQNQNASNIANFNKPENKLPNTSAQIISEENDKKRRGQEDLNQMEIDLENRKALKK